MRKAYCILPFLTVSVLLTGGCAGPGPRLFQTAPVAVEQVSGGQRRWYDFTGQGHGDYYEFISPQGRVTEIGYASCGESTLKVVRLDEVPPREQRHLVLLLDSVPYVVAEDYWNQGRLRYFYRPVIQVSPFPVMTDLSFAEFFGSSPEGGVEAEYHDGRRMTSGYNVYAAGTNAKWERYSDYVLSPMLHPEMYLDAYPWTNHEFRSIQDDYLRHPRPMMVAYSVGTSSLGANHARTGHEHALDVLEGYCRFLVYETQGRARITMLSDHGHAFYEGRWLPLAKRLGQLGYRVTRGTLKGPKDVAVPEFGLVSCAVVYTQSAAEVARDTLTIEGVEVSAYVDREDVVVLRKDGLARISRSSGRYRYAPEQGDPLEIMPAIEKLRAQGQVDAEGFIADDVLFQATAHGTYPDAVHRLWRAFHGLVEHTPDVMLSISEPYYVGSPTMKTVLRNIVGVHGSLRPMSTYGMCMTMSGVLPPVQRQGDLRANLIRIGVAVPGPSITTRPSGGILAGSPTGF